METMTPPITNEESGILFEYTFQLRKKAPDLASILSCINKLQDTPHYELLFSLIAENNRVFSIKSYENSSEHPTLEFNRKLKKVTNEVKMAVTKLNFAAAHDAKIVLGADETETLVTVTVFAPKNQRHTTTIVENFKFMQQ